MRAAPERQAERADGVSPFVAKSIATLNLPGRCDILDLPCGFGRHAIWLSQLGHRVTAADIDRTRIESFTTTDGEIGADRIRGMVVDATQPLPFATASFDGVVIVDYVSEALLSQIGSIVKPGGFLIYETFTARGHNWRMLLPSGRTVEMLEEGFQLTQRRRKRAGPDGEAETIKLVARRRG